MSDDGKVMSQEDLFGEGICTVCGGDVEPSLSKGQLVLLKWCSPECVRSHVTRLMTPKQVLFFEEYLVDLNATQAAIRAGYAPKAARQGGCVLLTNPNMRQAVDLVMTERVLRIRISATKVLADIEAVKQNAMIPDCNGHMVNHAAALKACELHGRHLKMFTDKTELGGNFVLNVLTGVPDLDDE